MAGTRPEVIKLYPLYCELQSVNAQVFWVSTGQHVGLGRSMLAFFGIEPDFLLPAVMTTNLASQLALLTDQLASLFLDQTPDLVIVQGDTATTLAGALAAFFLKIPIAYVEAGLRSFDLNAPFPEEANRQMIARISSLLFVPSEKELLYLMKENILANKIFVVGNTVVDALYDVVKKLDANLLLPSAFLHDAVSKAKKLDRPIVLFTLHRRESLDGLAHFIIEQLVNVFSLPEYKDFMLFYVRHSNPKLNFLADTLLTDPIFRQKVVVLEPLFFQDMVYLMQQSLFVMTDSGGLFEEAVSLGKPVVCLRELSERYDDILSDSVFMISKNAETFLLAIQKAVKSAYSKKVAPITTFGDGQASKKIVSFLQKFLGSKLA